MKLKWGRPRKDFLQILRREGITQAEMDLAMAEVERLSQLTQSEILSDSTVDGIKSLNKVWHRQKPEDAEFRTILEFQWDKEIIYIHAVMRRDNTTYERVREIYEETEE